MPFYKKHNEELLISEFVDGQGYMLSETSKDEYTYPIDGWSWFENLDAAISGISSGLSSSVISMAQCREQLIRLGLDDEVEAILASIPDPVKQKIYKSTWEYETIVKIDNVMLLELAPLLGIDIDKFFIGASKL
jgi:hypothetical protein